MFECALSADLEQVVPLESAVTVYQLPAALEQAVPGCLIHGKYRAVFEFS